MHTDNPFVAWFAAATMAYYAWVLALRNTKLETKKTS